ncbi:hypothetical protein ACF064_09915 [Streptomyces sp. NPDC015492]|uniref:hypothetical protein n=1 Tax=Streptomyces sp. NPDC015492 TaxID=3364958 RepID=UPI003700C9F2
MGDRGAGRGPEVYGEVVGDRGAGRGPEVDGAPRDPYTRELLAAVPSLDPARAADARERRRADGGKWPLPDPP